MPLSNLFRAKIVTEMGSFIFLIIKPRGKMKRKILLGVLLLLIAGAFQSCEVLSDCKTCKQVTYVSEKWDHETDPTEYCGASLLAIEAMDDYVDGNIRTTWVCD